MAVGMRRSVPAGIPKYVRIFTLEALTPGPAPAELLLANPFERIGHGQDSPQPMFGWGTRDGLPGVPGAPGAPARFRWRGRPYRVSDVLCHRVESGQWWSRTWSRGDESRADGARLPAAADMPGPSVGGGPWSVRSGGLRRAPASTACPASTTSCTSRTAAAGGWRAYGTRPAIRRRRLRIRTNRKDDHMSQLTSLADQPASCSAGPAGPPGFRERLGTCCPRRRAGWWRPRRRRCRASSTPWPTSRHCARPRRCWRAAAGRTGPGVRAAPGSCSKESRRSSPSGGLLRGRCAQAGRLRSRLDVVSAREAADLVRDSSAFFRLVCERLGLAQPDRRAG